MTITGLLCPARGKRSNTDAEGEKTVGGRHFHFRLQILGDTCPRMTDFLSRPALCCTAHGWLGPSPKAP